VDHSKRATDAQRLLDDPAFRESSELLEKGIIDRLKQTQLDGKVETERYILELVRTLQSAHRYQRLLWNAVEAGVVQDAALDRKTAFKRGL
jgi:hypothetical protein